MLKAIPAGSSSSSFRLYEDDAEIGSIQVNPVSSELFLEGTLHRL